MTSLRVTLYWRISVASNSPAPLNTQDFDGSSRTLLRRLGSIVAGACVFVVLALTGLPVAADTEIPMVKLGPWSQGLKVGATMNAQGVRLWGCKFVGQDLSGANFDGCCLGNVIFEQCDLSDATFRDTVLTGALIHDCEFGGNDFSGAVINGMIVGWQDAPALSVDQLIATRSFIEKNLDQTTIVLRRPTGSRYQPPSLDFDNFSMRNTTFVNVDLTRSTFEGATIVAPKFRVGKLRFQELAKAKILDLNGSRFKSAKIVDRADLSHRRIQSIELFGELDVSLSNANILGASLGTWLTFDQLRRTSSYRTRTLSRIRLYRCDLTNADLSNQLLDGSYFSDCNFSNCKLDNAILTNAGFSDACTGLTAEQIRSTWNFKHRQMDTVQLPKNLQAEF